MPQRAPRTGDRSTGTGGYRGLGVIATVKQEAADLERIFGNRVLGGVGISLGKRGLPVYSAGAGLPRVASTPAGGQTATLPPQIDRRDEPQDTEQLSLSDFIVITGTLDDFEWHKKMFPNKKILHKPTGRVHVPGKTDAAPVPVRTGNIPLQTTNKGGSMDLGSVAVDLLKQAGTAYINRELMPTQPVYNSPMIPDQLEQHMPWYLDETTGTIRTTRSTTPCHRRRRRRPIATNAEIAQLASLKSIATPSEVKLFLAKRLRN